MLSAVAGEAYGRRPVAVGSAALYVVGSVGAAAADAFGGLAAARCVLGLAVGLASSTIPLYLAESAPPASRGAAVTASDMSIVGGQGTDSAPTVSTVGSLEARSQTVRRPLPPPSAHSRLYTQALGAWRGAVSAAPPHTRKGSLFGRLHQP